MKDNFRIVAIIGVFLILISISLLLVFPQQPSVLFDGLQTPIFAFEFVETKGEVAKLLGKADSQSSQRIIKKMDTGNQIDFLFMFTYSLFFTVFAIMCFKETNSKINFFIIVIALLVFSSDIMENVQLLRITKYFGRGNIEDYIRLLHYFTWLKWGGITLIFQLFLPYFISGDLFSKWIGRVAGLNLILALLAFSERSFISELYVYSVEIMFILMIIYSFIHKTTLITQPHQSKLNFNNLKK